MIRPSLLNAVERCGLVAKLAEEYPEASAYTKRGNEVDEQVTIEARGGKPAHDADAQACIRWLTDKCAGRVAIIQEKVRLTDPRTGVLISEGTPDIQIPDPALVVTIDWKKREQYAAGLLAHPDDSLQLHTYSLARALLVGAEAYQNVAVLFGGGEVEALESRVYPAAEWWPIIDRIKAVQGKEAIASPGAHCHGCYQRWVCPSYRERAKLATSLLEQDPRALQLTDETAAELLMRAELVEDAADLAKKMVQEHVRKGGRVQRDGKRYLPVIQKGRRSANVEALEAAGLHEYVRQGAPFDRWIWKRA